MIFADSATCGSESWTGEKFVCILLSRRGWRSGVRGHWPHPAWIEDALRVETLLEPRGERRERRRLGLEHIGDGALRERGAHQRRVPSSERAHDAAHLLGLRI